MEMLFPELKPPSEAEKGPIDETRKEVSALEEAGQILAKMSGPGDQASENLEKSVPEEKPLGKEDLPEFAWMDDFRRSVEAYFQEHLDPFSLWFEECKKGQADGNRLETLLMILVHSRFDQMTRPEKALGNTQKVYPFILKENLSLETIRPLKERSFSLPTIGECFFTEPFQEYSKSRGYPQPRKMGRLGIGATDPSHSSYECAR